MALSSSRHTVLFLCIIAVAFTIGNADLDIGFKSAACNGRTTSPTADFTKAVNYALYNGVNNVWNGDYNYYGSGSYGYGTAYTHARCNGDLDKDDCRKCAEIAKRHLIQHCGFHMEGWTEVVNCFINRWEFPNK